MKPKHRACIDNFLSMPKDVRDKYADRHLWKVIALLRERGYTVAKIHETILGIFRFFVSADLSCEQGEYELYKTLTGTYYTNDQFFAMTNHGRKEEFVQNTLNWMHGLSDELFTEIFTIGGYIMTADGTLHPDEEKLIELVESYRPE